MSYLGRDTAEASPKVLAIEFFAIHDELGCSQSANSVPLTLQDIEVNGRTITNQSRGFVKAQPTHKITIFPDGTSANPIRGSGGAGARDMLPRL